MLIRIENDKENNTDTTHRIYFPNRFRARHHGRVERRFKSTGNIIEMGIQSDFHKTINPLLIIISAHPA